MRTGQPVLTISRVRRVASSDRAMRQGQWLSRTGHGIRGQCLGLLGLGRIGQCVARIGQAFGMQVVAWSENLRPEAAAAVGVQWVERDELFRQAKLISVAFMPYKTTVHRFSNELLQPWVVGYRRPVFWLDWWHVVDIDTARQPKAK